MRRAYHRWHSPRLGFDMGVVVHGHWGSPLLGFPTSAGDEWELEHQGLIDALADFIDGGKVKFFSVNSINGLSFYNKGAHPFHRSYVQAVFDSYLREEVVPFIFDNCEAQWIAISTFGASFGAYHAANSLFKHPDVIKRCFAMSGVYDLKNFMDGQYDDNFYFNNPVDYLANLSDSRVCDQLATCDIHISTGCGPWEHSGPSYRLSQVLASKNIRHSLDDWGPMGGHDWPYWKHQLREYIARLF
jgi:esterase/lipase superfamily enzyme